MTEHDDTIEDTKQRLSALNSPGQIYTFLIEEFTSKGPQEATSIHETLEYLVDDAKMAEAAEINKEGMSRQIPYLLSRNPNFASALATILFD